MKKVTLMQSSILFLCAAQVYAGGEVNNGGGFARDHHNPWFLGNVTNVSYCIEVDERNFGVTRDALENYVRLAIKFWKEAFDTADIPDSSEIIEPKSALQVASQTFNLNKNCSEATDIRFQFGILNKEQEERLKNPKDYVAVTVRTSYDEVNLRGKGFVYFSPESGSLRPEMKHFADTPWSTCNGCILRSVLYHELGHVFGLPHDFGYIMNARMPENMTHEKQVQEIANIPEIWERIDYSLLHSNPFGFAKQTIHFRCEEPDNGYRPTSFDFFGAPDKHLCMELDIFDFISDQIQIRSGPTANSELKPLGTISLGRENIRNEKLGRSIRIWITPKQKVFSRLPDNLMERDYLTGPSGYEYREYKAYYKPFDSQESEKEVFVILSPNSELRIGGIHKGLLVSDLFLGRVEPIVTPFK